MGLRRLLLGAGVIAAVSCGGDDAQGPGNGGNPPPGGGDDVSVRNNSFSPSTLEVEAGTTVTWTWVAGSTDHNVTFDDGEESATQSSGSYQRAFAAVGNFPYHCTIHGSVMSGVVNVVATGGDTGGDGGDGGGGGGYLRGGTGSY